MESCIYEGRVKHARTTPVLHRFSYRLFLMYLDLDELPALFEKRWLWSAKRRAVARFRRADHLGPSDQPLADSVRDLVHSEIGKRPQGPVRLLTNLSYFGYCFNPVSFYYCFDESGDSLEAIVAEVNNTPWGEQNTYVLQCKGGKAPNAVWRFAPEKKMHVSPFMPMDVEYNWAFVEPDRRLAVYMANSKDGKRFFDVSMNMIRTEITGRSLAGVLTRFPLMTVKVILAIYWQALRLFIKRCPLYAHPNKKRQLAVRSQ